MGADDIYSSSRYFTRVINFTPRNQEHTVASRIVENLEIGVSDWHLSRACLKQRNEDPFFCT
jgi:hypothetical protein